MSSFVLNINTKLEAYKLVHDPTRLLCLLYTKYGDIEEDYNCLIINQLLYNKFTHINSKFKDDIIHNDIREFFRRMYNKKECKDRMPKLYDYYKNYYKYYCRPFFINFYMSNILHNYFNIQAEIFYKNNYSITEEKKNSEKIINTNSNTISSFDNDTDNKIIFDKRNKYIIDNNIETNRYSITLTNDNISKDIINWQSKRSINNSFEQTLENFFNISKNNKTNKTNKNIPINENNDNNYNKPIKEENNKINNVENIDENFFQNEMLKNKLMKNGELNIQLLFNEKEMNNQGKKEKNIKAKSNNNNIIKNNNKNNFDFNLFKGNTRNNIFPLKISKNSKSNSKLDLKNNNNTNKKRISIGNVLKEETSKKNINCNISNSGNNNKNNKNNKIKHISRNKYKQNFFKLSCQLDNKKAIYLNKNCESRNTSKKENDYISLNDFITLKNNKNNNQKIFKLNNIQINNNNCLLFNNEKIKSLSIDKSAKENNKFSSINPLGIKKAARKLKTMYPGQKKYKSTTKLNVLNKFSSILFNKNNSKNSNNNLIKNNSEFPSSTHSLFFRNELRSKKNYSSKKLSLFNSIEFEKKNNHQKKKKSSTNINDSNNDNDINNFLNNNLKIFNSHENNERRNSNIISKNLLFKNYTMGKILLGANSNYNNKKVLNRINLSNIKNVLYISRNKSKNSTNTFHAKSVPLSKSQSKSKSKDNESHNLLNALNLKLNNNSNNNFNIDNKKVFINNLKMQSKNNSLNKYEDKYLKNISRNMFNTFGIYLKNGGFNPTNPINLKQNFNFNKRIFKNGKNKLNHFCN